MATLKEAIQIAKQDPNSEKSQQLIKYLAAGKFDAQAAAEGIDLTKFKAKNTPMGTTATKIPSVAEREGWLPKLGAVAQQLPGAMKQFAQENDLANKKTAPLKMDPKVQISENELELRSKANAAPEGSWGKQFNESMIQKDRAELEGRDFKSRAVGAVKGIEEAAKEGVSNFVQGVKQGAEGSDIYDAGQQGLKQQEKFMGMLDDSFKAGKIDQTEYDRIKNQIQGRMDRAQGFKSEGAAQTAQGVTGAMKGISETIVSPMTGAISGGFKPEFEALGERVAGNETASKAVQYLSEKWDTLDPSVQNSLSTVLNLAGLGATKATGKAALKGAAPMAQNLKQGAKEAVQQFPKTAEDFMGGVKQGAMDLKQGASNLKQTVSDLGAKVPKFGKEAKQAQVVKLAEDILRPLPTESNIRKALSNKQKVTEGKKTLFSGSKDIIENSPRVKRAATTLSKEFPELNKLSPTELPLKIDDKISEIANPLKNKFKEISIDKNLKDKLTATGEKTLRELKGSLEYPSIKILVSKFEKEFLPKITKKIKGKDGKFKQASGDDVWDLAKAWDSYVPDRVKNATQASESSLQASQEAWLKTRKVFRGLLEDLAQRTSDPETAKAFQKMADLYEAKTQIIKNVKPTNKSGASKIGDFWKEYKNQALVGATGIYGVNKLTGD